MLARCVGDLVVANDLALDIAVPWRKTLQVRWFWSGHYRWRSELLMRGGARRKYGAAGCGERRPSGMWMMW